MAATGRETAFRCLIRMKEDGAWSNLVLDQALRQLPDHRERQLAAALFYGVLERKITLDRTLAPLLSRPLAKLDTPVLVALELGLYQILWMDGIPNAAAVNESVSLVRRSRCKSAAGMVNGVLRGFLRSGGTLPEPKGDALAQAEFRYSMPRWILEVWEKAYGQEQAVALAEACLGRPPLQLRVNTLKTSTQALTEELLARGIRVIAHPILPDCLTVEGLGSVGELDLFQQGLCYPQDTASQLCAAAVDPQPGERIYDLCAAPGSKSFTMAQRMEDRGELLSFDLYDHRVGLIRSGAERLGIHCIEARTGDAARFDAGLGEADRVLCDVPCSGLGVIRRKPEIRHKTPEELQTLPPIQRAILDNAARYVRQGGILVYSTCTLNPGENEEIARDFLAQHPDWAAAPLPENLGRAGHMTTLTPMEGYDGFFIARFQRRG